jgi:hypothetical protein
MTQINAAARLMATAHKVVEGEGQRWNAVQFPNGRFGVIDTQRENGTLAAGLDEADAIEAVKIANANHKWHPTLTHKEIRDNRKKYGFQH